MFEGFETQRLDVNGVTIYTRTAGKGPPLLLLHGYPQSHVIWHRVAPQLAANFSVVLTDLRGYGASSKPEGLADHSNYSKRAMAQDQVDVMRALRHERFFVCGHDRGGRVAHRMAVDHADRVLKLMTLDIAPTLAMYEQTSMAFARAYWWWFFLIQPAPFPEQLIAAAPELYLKKKIGWGHAGMSAFTEETYNAYLANVSDADTMHAMCEDYRAAAGIDLEHDRADREAGRKVSCPVNALWGEHGVIGKCFKPLDEWRRVAMDVRGRAVASGHYIPEEIPGELLEEMLAFFAG